MPGQRLHGQKRALHIGMLNDRGHAVALVVRGFALPPFVGVGERLLECGFRDAHALHADGKAGIVHHGEHAGEAAVFLANEPADSAFRQVFREAVAVDHGAGRRGMDAELVLQPRTEDIVALAKAAVVPDQEFRHEKQRNAAGSRRRIGEARQHQMHDVFGQVMLAISDENLLA